MMRQGHRLWAITHQWHRCSCIMLLRPSVICRGSVVTTVAVRAGFAFAVVARQGKDNVARQSHSMRFSALAWFVISHHT